MPKFSIIVPIYNVDSYLSCCLHSIHSQIYSDFECLLINDGSTDSSEDIALDICNIDSRFKYYYKKNGGLSDARNYGLAKAKGDYIVFIDSDDFISLYLLSWVNDAIQKGATDVIYYDYIKIFTKNEYENILMTSSTHDKFDFKFISQKELSQKPNFACTRVVRRELYEKNLFPTGLIYEDVLTSPVLSYRAKSIGHIKSILYGYRKRPNSITTGSAEKQFLLFSALEKLREREKLGDISYKFYSTAFVNLIQSCIVSLVRINDKNSRKKYREIINYQYNKISFIDVVTSYSHLKFKLLTIFSKSNLTLYMLEIFLRPIVFFSDKRNH